MELKNGNLYFLDEKYFNFLNDPKIKQNKNSSRPWVFAFEDKENNLLWFIPCSGKVDKFSEIIEARKREKKKHNHIQIIKIQGRKEVFLYQDMIPVEKKFVLKEYRELKNPKIVKRIIKNSSKIQKQILAGVKFTKGQANVKEILNKLKNKKEIKMETSKKTYFYNLKEMLKENNVTDKDFFKSLVKSYRKDLQTWGNKNDNKEIKNIKVLNNAIENKNYISKNDLEKVLINLDETEFNLAIKFNGSSQKKIDKYLDKNLQNFETILEPMGSKKDLLNRFEDLKETSVKLENPKNEIEVNIKDILIGDMYSLNQKDIDLTIKAISKKPNSFWEVIHDQRMEFKGYNEENKSFSFRTVHRAIDPINPHQLIDLAYIKIPLTEWKKIKNPEKIIFKNPVLKKFEKDCPALKHLSDKGKKEILEMYKDDSYVAKWEHFKNYLKRPEHENLQNEVIQCKIKEQRTINQNKDLEMGVKI